MSIEAAISHILTAHFEDCANPHETIHKIWLLMNTELAERTTQEGNSRRIGRTGSATRH